MKDRGSPTGPKADRLRRSRLHPRGPTHTYCPGATQVHHVYEGGRTVSPETYGNPSGFYPSGEVVRPLGLVSGSRPWDLFPRSSTRGRTVVGRTGIWRGVEGTIGEGTSGRDKGGEPGAGGRGVEILE